MGTIINNKKHDSWIIDYLGIKVDITSLSVNMGQRLVYYEVFSAEPMMMETEMATKMEMTVQFTRRSRESAIPSWNIVIRNVIIIFNIAVLVLSTCRSYIHCL